MSTVISFCLFLLAFVVIGALSVLKNRHNNDDYLLASQSVSPFFVALSAIATNNSGYMFIGMIGFTYLEGLSSIWLMIGWIFGDFCVSMFVHRQLRTKTESFKSLSYVETLDKWGQFHSPLFQRISALMIVVLLGVYAAAQFQAGSKALHVLFGWDYSVGAIIGSIIVVIYCLAGGIRASIWTDVAQSFVMIIAMSLLVIFSAIEMGGIKDLLSALNNVSVDYMDLFPKTGFIGPVADPVLFVIGWMFAGFGIIGQPHIMVRFMAMKDVSHITRMRIYYYTWYILFYSMTIIVGLCSRLILPGAESFDAELALPQLASQLLPDMLVGLTLAGLFAATMSTADSQVLVCTASITRDFNLSKEFSYWATKAVTFLVVFIALIIALSGSDSVFVLVLFAWSSLACVFGPVLIVLSIRQTLSVKAAFCMMSVGLFTMLTWRWLGLGDNVYEVMPGMIASFVVYGVYRMTLRLSQKFI